MRVLRGKVYFLVVVLLVAAFVSPYQASDAYAAQITTRSLQLLTGGSGDGGSLPGGTVNHQFTFDIAGNQTIGSLRFEYCTIATVEPCVAPTGMTSSDGTTNATLGGNTGDVTGFSMGTTTANSFILTRVAASATAGDTVIVQANNVINPSTANYTFFVRISTYPTTDASGSPTDEGTVAASTANPIQLSGVMPESLIFCTGATITANAGIPDCSSATAGTVEFDQLFSPTDTATASSQMAASTNALYGYVITVNGPTLTSGGNTIPAMSPLLADAPIAPSVGTSQFGMNLRLNTTAVSTVAVGADIDLPPDGTDLRGQPATDYNTVDSFKYSDGDVIASSDNGGAGPTNAQLITASYIVNVAGNQLAGTYSTTLTYVCTPTF